MMHGPLNVKIQTINANYHYTDVTSEVGIPEPYPSYIQSLYTGSCMCDSWQKPNHLHTRGDAFVDFRWLLHFHC
jgi:hypothetical protein